MTILCLCGEEHHWKMLPPFAKAVRTHGVDFVCVDWSVALDSPLDTLLRRCPEKPACILYFESNFPLLPEGLTGTEIPTVCLQVDTYAFTERRIRWSSLFDHVAVFHPGYEETFRRAGHPGAFLFPHAVRKDLFEQPEVPRTFEVGWVGQTCGPLYRKREKWIPKLASQFRMNDWSRSYSLEEVAEVYRKSKIVVNMGRDDFPQDANMRVFEVLASGALLVTSLPSELTALGFQEGIHFVGYRDENEIIPVVEHFLRAESRRLEISRRGRSKALDEHTYECRADQLIKHLERFGGRKLAPARSWTEPRVRLMYVDFFAAHGVLDCAEAQFRRIVGRGLFETMAGGALLTKAWIKRFCRGRGAVRDTRGWKQS